jgi:hypothetical protein
MHLVNQRHFLGSFIVISVRIHIFPIPSCWRSDTFWFKNQGSAFRREKSENHHISRMFWGFFLKLMASWFLCVYTVQLTAGNNQRICPRVVLYRLRRICICTSHFRAKIYVQLYIHYGGMYRIQCTVSHIVTDSLSHYPSHCQSADYSCTAPFS